MLPDATYDLVPLADGGEGTVDSLVDALHGEIVGQVVTGPAGAPVDGFFGLVDDGATAIIELAAASGLHLVPPDQRDPMTATSAGTGELVRAALDRGVEHVILGLGGSGTVDGGAGLLQALGVALLDGEGEPVGPGGGALDTLARVDLSGFDPRLSDVTVEVASDVDSPLCGPHGAARVYGPQKGATEPMVEELDRNLSHLADVLREHLGRDVRDLPGGGAAGGVSAALYAVLGVRPQSGIDLVMETVQLAARLGDADLVVTGEGRMDGQSIRGKTPVGVSRLAARHGVPVVAIAGSTSRDVAVLYDHGIAAVFSAVPGPCTLAEALAGAAANVEATAANVARGLLVGAGLVEGGRGVG